MRLACFRKLGIALSIGMASVLAHPSQARAEDIGGRHAQFDFIGGSKAWTAIRTASPDGDRICAIYATPAEGDAVLGEKAAFLSWVGEKPSRLSGEFSAVAGFPVAKGMAGHALIVDGKTRFDLVGHGDRVYGLPQDDAAISRALRAGRSAKLRMISANGAVMEDAYSLEGVVRSTTIAMEGC